MSSCLSQAALDEDSTEAVEAEQPHTQDEAGVGGVESKSDAKDILHTKKNGDIVVKISPYTIPKTKRLVMSWI